MGHQVALSFEDGVTKVPEFEQDSLRRNDLGLRADQRDPNGMNRVTLRGNHTTNL